MLGAGALTQPRATFQWLSSDNCFSIARAGKCNPFWSHESFFFPCYPLFIKLHITQKRMATTNSVASHQDLANNIWKWKKRKVVLLALCSHAWPPRPLIEFLVFGFVLGFFMLQSITVFISYLFHFKVYHGKCTDFFC